MKVWGIGATWEKSMIKKFEEENAVAIGWEEKDAPALYGMMNEIEPGDLVYVKSFVIKGKKLSIKAVGEVVGNDFRQPYVFGENHGTIHVKWRENSFKHTESYMISSQEIRYNVYSHTLYREYNSQIIEKVLNY
ncbi:MAG: hypothetical protein GX800_13425 [Clostridiaceae bacterium]|nr:hypothetical protein [Clostridiaceae bacterium]